MKAIVLTLVLFTINVLYHFKCMAQPSLWRLQEVTNAVEMMMNAQGINAKHYCCSSMVQVVNKLRHLGKEDALLALRIYNNENVNSGDDIFNEKILLVCRLLFENP